MRCVASTSSSSSLSPVHFSHLVCVCNFNASFSVWRAFRLFDRAFFRLCRFLRYYLCVILVFRMNESINRILFLYLRPKTEKKEKMEIMKFIVFRWATGLKSHTIASNWISRMRSRSIYDSDGIRRRTCFWATLELALKQSAYTFCGTAWSQGLLRRTKKII